MLFNLVSWFISTIIQIAMWLVSLGLKIAMWLVSLTVQMTMWIVEAIVQTMKSSLEIMPNEYQPYVASGLLFLLALGLILILS